MTLFSLFCLVPYVYIGRSIFNMYWIEICIYFFIHIYHYTFTFVILLIRNFAGKAVHCICYDGFQKAISYDFHQSSQTGHDLTSLNSKVSIFPTPLPPLPASILARHSTARKKQTTCTETRNFVADSAAQNAIRSFIAQVWRIQYSSHISKSQYFVLSPTECYIFGMLWASLFSCNVQSPKGRVVRARRCIKSLCQWIVSQSELQGLWCHVSRRWQFSIVRGWRSWFKSYYAICIWNLAHWNSSIIVQI